MEDITEVLKQNNIKKTAPRITILTILANNSNPISENEIKLEMGAMYDRATFYRSIQILIEAGLVHKINANNINVYAYTRINDVEELTKKNHVHFFCNKCNKISCFENITVRDYNIPQGYTFENCEVLIKGICKDCK